jgi:perosamine synthetase
MALAKKHNLTVIEDSAQTVLGSYKRKLPGTIGHINVFSFENKKHLTCGSEGGMIVSNDENLAKRARKFAGIGYKHMTATAGRTSLALSEVQDPDYERFDTVGLNYRMNELSAAVGIAQLERVEQIVARRQKVAAFFREAITGCDWLTEQSIPNGFEHSHYTFTVKYYGDKKHNVKWKEFYNQYVAMGGDGFYGACKVPYLEPALKGKFMNGAKFSEGICPIAESVQPQPRIMQFKTNYRDLEVAKKKAAVLKDLVQKMGGNKI